MNYEPQDSHIAKRDWLPAIAVVVFVALLALFFGLIAPANASRTHIPAWLHVTPTHRYIACHGPGVIVYGRNNAPDGDGGTSALVCRNGRAYVS